MGIPVTRGLALCLVASVLALGCDGADDGGDAASLAQRLGDNISFRLGQLIGDGLPDTTDEAVALVQLGPATLLSPGGSELLAFEVTDPEARAITATLLQFDGDDSHLRGPIAEGGGSVTTVISNEVDVSEALCEGLCDGVLSLNAKVAVELAGGAISSALAIEIAVDCRGKGTEGACTLAGGGPGSTALICDDVTQGGAALTNDAQLDAYFDAVRTLALYSHQTNEAARDALAEVRGALGLGEGGDVPSELEARIAEATEMGLQVLIGAPGCAARAARVQHTLRVCDRSVTTEQASVTCDGLCEPGSDRNACTDAAGTGCRGVLQGGVCDGTCTGACQVELAAPRICIGTCIGTCEGSCNGEEGGPCNGPCTGLCSGECREPNSGVCDGTCTGFCEASTTPAEDDPLPACTSPLFAYCSSGEAPILCRADCFGEAAVTAGAPICQASALAMGQLSARCDAPVVQIYFAYAAGTEPSTQQAFATLIDGVNDPITTLLVLVERIDLLENAAASLAGVSEGAVAERIAAQIEGIRPESMACAEDVVAASTPWLRERIDLLRELRAEILALAAVLDTTGL